MPVTAKFDADFKNFMKAAESAEGALDKLASAAGVTERSVDRAAKAFSGENLIASAIKATEGVNAIGGAAKLTESEMARVNRTVTEAIEKMKLLVVALEEALRLPELLVVAAERRAPVSRDEAAGIEAGGGIPLVMLSGYIASRQILRDLGVKRMTLLSNTPKTIIGLDGYGLTIDGHRPFTGVVPAVTAAAPSAAAGTSR